MGLKPSIRTPYTVRTNGVKMARGNALYIQYILHNILDVSNNKLKLNV